MSFAEDEGHDLGGMESLLESMWEDGFHQDIHFKQYKLSEMTAEHLKNTINYFSDCLDTTPLQEELNKRIK